MSRKGLYIRINGELINVPEEVYLTYYRMESRARYLERKDIRNGKTIYSNLDTVEITGEETIPNLEAESVEDAALKSIMIEKIETKISVQLSVADPCFRAIKIASYEFYFIIESYLIP